MFSDLRLALRQLAKSPAYTIVVVLTLAVGIAVNSNLFGMVGSFFLRQLPIADAGRLAVIVQRSEAWNMPHPVSFPDFKDYRERTTTFRELIAFSSQPAHLSVAGQPAERAWIELVTPDAFSAFGLRPALGRTLLPADGEGPGGAAVAVLTHRYWQSRFGGDPGIIGRVVLLNGHPFTIVGVTAPGFDGFQVSLLMSAFVPSGAATHLSPHGNQQLQERWISQWRVLGRLRPGATVAAAHAEVDAIGRSIAQDHPQTHKGARALVYAESRCRPDPSMADFNVVFSVLFAGLVLLVLGIACANVTNLMLARALTRQRELTLCTALGASRGRLIRQLLTESLILAAVAGVAGWVLATWTGDLFARFVPTGDMPVNADSAPALRDYLFTAVVSLLAGLGSGLLPALRASRVNIVDGLREGGTAVAAGRHRLRNMLVSSQVTFSLVVLVGAGLLLQSLHRARDVSLGFDPQRLLLVSFDLGLQGYPQERGEVFHRQLLEQARALPGVASAALSRHVPFDYAMQMSEVWPEDPPPQLTDGRTVNSFSPVDPGWFALLQLPVLRGRALAATDTAATPRVAVINEAMARQCWPDRDALGRRFRPWRDGPWIEVVGIVPTGRYVMISEPSRPYFYVPLAQQYSSPLTLVLRTHGDPALLARPVTEVIRALDPHLPVYNVRTMDELMRSSIFALLPLRMGATIGAVQGVTGLLLAVLGLYAVVAQGVNRRVREIGIRMALGAEASTVVRLVVREGLKLTLEGIAIGLFLSAALAFVMSRLLFGLGVLDVTVVAGATVLLVAVSALACWLPARKATRVNPVDALRAE